MIELRHEVGGDLVKIYVVEHPDDLEGFRDFISAHTNCLAVDTETTGLDIYSDDFRCRLIQFGNQDEAWVLPVEESPTQLQGEAFWALEVTKKLVFQNASYDLQVLDRCFGFRMESLWPKVIDTQILAKLVDPRPFKAGGFGHSLEELIAAFISEDLARDVKGLMVKLAQEHKTTKSKIWKVIDLWHPEYLKYAGMDVIFTSRICRALAPRVPDSSRSLVEFERQISEICSYIDRQGFLLDVEYSEGLSRDWLGEKEVWDSILLTEYGIDSVGANRQVASAFEDLGYTDFQYTDSGEKKVDKAFLAEMEESGGELAQLAAMVSRSKQLGKWNQTWVMKFLSEMDSNHRCHTFINPLQARTSRMSITGIPAQTLPASDWLVRRCFIADEGHVMASIDYQAQELRVLAALSGDQNMIDAFKADADLHQMTADAAGVPRKVGKMANFQKVYGGGFVALAEAAGISIPTAKRVHEAFARTYPGVTRLADRLSREAGSRGYITNPMGRRLPVDSSRTYSALNYMVQSTSRDVTCRALIRLHKAGFTPYIRLPIHDEIVASLPAEKANWGAREIARLMQEQMGPVLIGTDPEVGKRSWGSLYGAEE